MAAAITIPLNVLSYSNKNMTTYEGSFVVRKMNDLRANQNESSSVLIAVGTAGVTSGWKFYGNLREGQILYWWLETTVDDIRRVRIYSNSAKTNIIAEGTADIADNTSGNIIFLPLRDSGISGQVTVTLGGSLTDQGNTLTFTDVTAESNLQLDGNSQFMYQDGKERLVKVTVLETVAAILELQNPTDS